MPIKPKYANSVASQPQIGNNYARPKYAKMPAMDIVNASLNEFNRSIPGFDEAAALATVGRDSAGDLLSGRKNAPTFAQRWNNTRANQEAISKQFNQQHPLGASTARAIGYTAPMLIPGLGEANASRLTTQATGKAGQQATKAIVQYGAKNAIEKAGQRAVITGAKNTTKAAQAINATKRPLASKVAKGASSASAQAAINAFADKGTLAQRTRAASKAAANPFVIGLGGATGAIGAVGSKTPKQMNPKVAQLIKANIPLTYGQRYGGLVKKLEDLGTSVPIVGYGIQKARQRAADANVLAIFNKDLSKIGEKLPSNIRNGSEAMQYATDAFNREYNKVLSGVTIKPTNILRDRITNSVQNTPFTTDNAKAQAANILGDRVTSRIFDKPEITGREFQDMVSSLRAKGSQYGKSPDPVNQDIGNIINDVRGAWIDEAAAQNPNFGNQYNNVNSAYRGFTQARKAASGAGIIDGNFTPKQYLSAVQRTDDSIGKGNYARGQAFNQDYANAAADILPSKTPDSGTSERVGAYAGLGALGTSLVMKPAVGIPVSAAAGTGYAAYSKPVLDLFNKHWANQLSKEEAAAVNYQINNDPAFRAMWDDLSQRASRSIGASQGQQQAQ